MQNTALTFAWILILLATLLPSRRADAVPTLHKCVDASGTASYQSEPCAPNRREAWSKSIEPDPPPLERAARDTGSNRDAATQRSAPQNRRSRTSTGKRNGADGGSGRSRPPGSQAVGAHLGVTANSLSPQCEAARRRRDQTLERVGLKRTYALLQKLDNAVHQACN